MNIHSTDIELFEKLKDATLAKVVVGSHMYGTNTEESDTDYLYIYATSKNELLSAIQVHHQIQFKIDGNDYNFVSLHSFLRNCISGDSTINFEVIHDDALLLDENENNHLSWLNEYKNDFITYTIVRSYLGFARRDIKHYHKYKDEYNRKKRLRHIIRGYIYARDMISGNFDIDVANYELRGIELDVKTNHMLRKYEKLISDLRTTLNEKFNNKTLGLAQHFNVNSGKEFTKDLIEFCDSDTFTCRQSILDEFDMSDFINSFENWVEY